MFFEEEKNINETLEKIEKDFIAKFNNSPETKRLLAAIKIKPGYRDAQDFAIEAARTLSNAFKDHITKDVLVDGRMYLEMADTILKKTLGTNYKLITDYSKTVQEALNSNAGIGIKAITPPINTKRIDGMVEKIAGEDFENVSWVLDAPVETFSLSIIDEFIQANADFHSRSGLTPKITRSARGKCCDWCDNLVGTYEYEDVKDTGNEVFRRHSNCRCLVEYVPIAGPRRNVWTHRNSS